MDWLKIVQETRICELSALNNWNTFDMALNPKQDPILAITNLHLKIEIKHLIALIPQIAAYAKSVDQDQTVRQSDK